MKPTPTSGFMNIIHTVTSPSTWIGIGLLRGLPGFGGVDSKIDKTFCGINLSPVGAVAAGAGAVIVQAVVTATTGGVGALPEDATFQEVAAYFLQALGSSLYGTAKGLAGSPAALGKTLGTLTAFTAFSIGIKLVAMTLASSTFSGAETNALTIPGRLLAIILRRAGSFARSTRGHCPLPTLILLITTTYLR